MNLIQNRQVHIFLILGFLITIFTSVPTDSALALFPLAHITLAPSAIDVDSKGNVYVLDDITRQVFKMTGQGNLIDKWDLNMEGSLAGKKKFYFGGIAIDPKGYVYVSFVLDVGAHSFIQKFGNTGTFISEWETGYGVYSFPPIAVDSKGYVYVGTHDGRWGEIKKYTNNGNLVTEWNITKEIKETTDGALGITVKTVCTISSNKFITCSDKDKLERVFVVTMYHKFIEFTTKGLFVRTWGSEGHGHGEFMTAHGIDLDSSLHVFVSDGWGNERIQVLSPKGEYITEWGSWGKKWGQFDAPVDIAIDSKDLIYVADLNNKRIQIFKLGNTCGGFNIQIKEGVCLVDVWS